MSLKLIEAADTCHMAAAATALIPSMIIPKLGGSGVGWGPAITALFVGGIITSPITVPLLAAGALCDLVGNTKPLREEIKKK
jgi:hypothetical protein